MELVHLMDNQLFEPSDNALDLGTGAVVSRFCALDERSYPY
ncbi:hypothetical protein ACH4UM_29515 [Streptomyces sp. NPDC020801]